MSGIPALVGAEEHSYPADMKTTLLSVAGLLLLLATGCAGYLTVDGYEAEYADAPANYERAPVYEHNGARVYEVHGRYYREYKGRWVYYRHKPRDLREWRREGHERR
jgi:hypothetical protein